MKCPVCENNTNEDVCPICGYLLSYDLMNHRFINKLSQKEIDDYHKQIKIHKNLYLRQQEEPVKEPIIYNRELAQEHFEKACKLYDNKDYEGARKEYEEAAKYGKPLAYFYLGIIYRYALGVTKDLRKAYKAYEQSAKLGEYIAFRSMGEMCFKGEGVEADAQKGLDLYNQAIALNDDYANFDLGMKYYTGFGVLKKDYTQARLCFEKDIKGLRARDSSYRYLAEIYEKGLGVPKDLNKAKLYKQKSIGIIK